MKFKITQADADILKMAAAIESCPGIPISAIILEPGWRHNTEDRSKPSSMNMALVSDDPEWNDTDLDEYGTWREFRKGVDLTEDGRGIFDFYIRRRGDQYHELHGNVVLHVANGVMVKVTGYGQGGDHRWVRGEGYSR